MQSQARIRSWGSRKSLEMAAATSVSNSLGRRESYPTWLKTEAIAILSIDQIDIQPKPRAASNRPRERNLVVGEAHLLVAEISGPTKMPKYWASSSTTKLNQEGAIVPTCFLTKKVSDLGHKEAMIFFSGLHLEVQSDFDQLQDRVQEADRGT
jgi:hypothetical protein